MNTSSEHRFAVDTLSGNLKLGAHRATPTALIRASIGQVSFSFPAARSSFIIWFIVTLNICAVPI